MQAKPRMIVTIDPGKDVHTVADELRKRGYKVESELEFTGNVVLGAAETVDENEIRQIAGVADVSPERTDYTTY